jgi:hypothetical protein
MRHVITGTAVLLLSTAPLTHAADQVVQAGTVSFSAESPHPRVSLRGAETIDAVFDDGVFDAAACRPCEAGSQLRTGAFISAVGRGANQFVVGRDLRFTAPAVAVPGDGSAEVTLTAPFEFSGAVAFTPRRDADAEAVAASTWTGAGTATVHLTSIVDPASGKRLYFFEDLTYQFMPEGQP